MRRFLTALALLWPFESRAVDFTPCPGCPPMAVIPAGRFVMGDARSPLSNEKPEVVVEIPQPFALGKTEVSFDQWQDCVAAQACPGGQDDHEWGKGRRPVINMAWADAVAYATWIGARSGRVCRLPTEAEWEYAARAGTTSAFWWGSAAGKDHANCRDCLSDTDHPYGTRPVGSFPANPWGLSDMNGNVWEWTADCWAPDHARPASQDATCGARVVKGGSWYYFSPMARAAARARNDARANSYNIGFRILCELP